MKAIEIHHSTMLGVGGPRPVIKGNCFSVMAEDGKVYFVVNMALENLEHLIKHGKLEWPVEIHQLTHDHCMVVDDRISEDWFLKFDHFCLLCFPEQARSEVKIDGQ